MSGAEAVDVAVAFVWVGMVLAISFIEAPLKFKAPGVTIPLGLGIGRLVFRALNVAEALLALAVVVALAVDPPRRGAVVALVVAIAVLVVQVLVVRPRLGRRSDAVLAGEEGPRSRAHLWYVALEVVKTIALLTGGVLLLRA